ncbi:Mitochondrial import receptor subunit TOM34 [Camelus dromedarius]|uniref:Mitochondrial import receptor subunit TOM34 n=1 Tax=Camelus dromedarius TaxID=9838 RepID=A0A5N4CV17_CAMDR|nr:Mitochondrial import receptor subunit TOM34 [Camelus dromedarius]KAB1262690.1 Mitochondrial import receptor subunit TOM34 [Camelus dromedarius]KAB1262692.1 Mitochondrial import receptor subunit TOM34 [Camelus dromedarius]
MAPKRPDSVEELRAAGNQSFRNGQFAEAATLYSRALRALQAQGSLDPEKESVLYSNRAACHLKDGNCTDCIKDCTSALALVPFSMKPLLRRASAYEALEKYSLAYVDYMTVLQINDSVTSALEGSSRMTRALMDSFGPEWRLKLPSIPLVPVSVQKRWECLPSENHKETAESKSKETTAAKSRGSSALSRVVSDFTLTVALCGIVPSAGDVERAKVLKEEGNELVKKGNHKQAIEKYSESLWFSNLESATYSNRALCHLVLKQYKEAVQDCTEALKLDGKNVKAFYRRAQAYKALKDYKSSFADINSLLQIEPRNGPAQKLRQEVNRSLK